MILARTWITLGSVLPGYLAEQTQVFVEVNQTFQVKRVVDIGMIGVQLHESLRCRDRGRLLVLLVIGVGDLELTLLGVAPIGEACFQSFVALDREVVLAAIQRVFRLAVKLLGRISGSRIVLVDEGTGRQQESE